LRCKIASGRFHAPQILVLVQNMCHGGIYGGFTHSKSRFQ